MQWRGNGIRSRLTKELIKSMDAREFVPKIGYPMRERGCDPRSLDFSLHEAGSGVVFLIKSKRIIFLYKL